MRIFKIFGFFLIYFCHFAKAEFEERLDLSFRIRAIYKGPGIDFLGVRGNGLGLELFSSKRMTKSDEDGVWTYDIHYKSYLNGFNCMNCTGSTRFIPNGDDLKITFWAWPTDPEANEIRMVGDVFRIPLPQSMVSTYFDEKPVLDFYPYFFSRAGDFVTLEVESTNEDIGTREMVVYMPPGFKENPRPEYDVYFVIDLAPAFIDLIAFDLNLIFTSGVAQEAIVVGHGDWKADPVTQDTSLDRTLQLTPVPGDDFACKEGSFLDNCNGCLPSNLTYEEYIYWMTGGGCGILISSGGNGEANVEFLLTTVYETVDDYLRQDYGSGLTRSRKGKFVMGYSFGGIFSCYAAWTRPESFGGAACQSSSFGWPLIVSDDSTASGGFYFINTTLKSHLDDRLPQKILIDVGGLEEDPIYQSVSAAERIFETISEHPMFEANRNLWFHIYPDEAHSSFSWIKRFWNGFKVLSSGRH